MWLMSFSAYYNPQKLCLNIKSTGGVKGVIRMSKVNTVTGSLTTTNLGKTLIHEHALIGYPGWFLDKRQPAFKRKEAMKKVVDAFQRVKDFGVESIVDPCPSDMGRDAEFYAELSSKSGVNIVCATGVYYEAAGNTFTFRHMEQDAITEVYVREIEDGIGETGIKPGLIKVATGRGKITEYEQKVLAAAGEAARITGLPVLSHTEKCTCGHEQIDILSEKGVAASRILVGHADGTEDLALQRSLADRGVFLGFDRFGLEGEVTDDIRIANLLALAEEGRIDQLMMSHDYVACWKGGIPGRPPGSNFDEVLPNWRLSHIFENIIPILKQRGMTDADFDVILRDNPRRFFEREECHSHSHT